MPEFTRFTETITKKQDKRVVSISVTPIVIDCTDSVWFTDLMLQEGDKVIGYVVNTGTLLGKYDGDDATAGKRFYNGIVRSTATCVIFNIGSTAAGLDYKVYLIQAMAAGSISLALGEGAYKAIFKAAAAAGDEFDLFASLRECLKNGAATTKDGFFQYSAAGDSKRPITVEDKKSARIYVEFQEMQDGGNAL